MSAARLSRPVLPVSVVIATADRPAAMTTCLRTLSMQTVALSEGVVVDASGDEETRAVCLRSGLGARLVYVKATQLGAAAQRIEGLRHVAQPFVLFVDDDAELQPDCVGKLWDAMMSDERIGGVSAMLVNQQYVEPGRLGRLLYRIVAGRNGCDLPGRCLGPALTVWPADRGDLPKVVPVEWLNTTCTLYRRAALPTPLFPDRFVGYSLGEDVYLSLVVSRAWRLVNARTAHVVHRSRSGPHKPVGAALAKMSLVNRHYLMREVLGRRSVADYLKLGLVEAAEIVASLRQPGSWRQLPSLLAGKIQAVIEIAGPR